MAAQRVKAGVRADVMFQTKPQITLDQIAARIGRCDQGTPGCEQAPATQGDPGPGPFEGGPGTTLCQRALMACVAFVYRSISASSKPTRRGRETCHYTFQDRRYHRSARFAPRNNEPVLRTSCHTCSISTLQAAIPLISKFETAPVKPVEMLRPMSAFIVIASHRTDLAKPEPNELDHVPREVEKQASSPLLRGTMHHQKQPCQFY